MKHHSVAPSKAFPVRSTDSETQPGLSPNTESPDLSRHTSCTRRNDTGCRVDRVRPAADGPNRPRPDIKSQFLTRHNTSLVFRRSRDRTLHVPGAATAKAALGVSKNAKSSNIRDPSNASTLPATALRSSTLKGPADGRPELTIAPANPFQRPQQQYSGTV